MVVNIYPTGPVVDQRGESYTIFTFTKVVKNVLEGFSAVVDVVNIVVVVILVRGGEVRVTFSNLSSTPAFQGMMLTRFMLP